MAEIRTRVLAPDFLEWLARFLGTWRVGDGLYRVCRRSDGWLEVVALEGCKRALAEVLRGGLAASKSPLGPNPVVLTQSLIERWLTPEDCAELRGAMHVSVGRAKLLERIEQRMRESGPEAVRAGERADWATGALDAPTIPPDDEPLIERLWSDYLREGMDR
jgi:hypothetical protein